MSKAMNLAKLLSSTGKVEADDLDVGTIGGRRNLIINGDFQVSQRGDYSSATVLPTSETYMLDRFMSRSFQVSGTITHGSGYPYYNDRTVRLDATSSGSGMMYHQHRVEGNHRGKELTFSFYLKTNSPEVKVLAYNVNNWSTDLLLGDYSSNGEWQRVSVTFTVENNTYGSLPLIIGIMGDAVSTNTTINSGDYFEITGVQLELGSVATPFEHRSYGEELALCQRYYQHEITMKANSLYWTGTGGYYGGPTFLLPVTMRATPSITKVADGTFSWAQGSTTQESSPNMTVEANQNYTSFHNNISGNEIFGCQIKIRLDAEL